MTTHPRHRRGFALSPVPAPAPVLALDLGGTRIRAAVVGPDGARIARTAAPTPSARGPAAVVDVCAAALRAALEAARTTTGLETADLGGIGISAPGPVDPWSGTVLEPPNLGPEFANIPLAAELEARFGLPAYLDRDTNVALLAERAFGAARGIDDAVYLTVSTGIGGAMVSGGQLVHGPDGLAGELGHLVVELDGPPCGCGGRGHVEAIASGVALAREARAAVARGESPFLATRAADDPSKLSARHVAAGELAGDAACAALMARARRAVAAACVGIANALNPHVIIIGGAIAAAQGERLLAPVRAAIASDVFPAIGRRIRVLPPQLGDDVSLAGAVPLVAGRRHDDRWRRGRRPLTAHDHVVLQPPREVALS